MRKRVAVQICFVLLVAAAGPAARGYGVESEDSLEWNLANADCVVHGRVTAVRYETHRAKGNGRVAGVEQLWRVLTVQVAEVLKGPAPRELTIAIPHDSEERPEAD